MKTSYLLAPIVASLPLVFVWSCGDDGEHDPHPTEAALPPSATAQRDPPPSSTTVPASPAPAQAASPPADPQPRATTGCVDGECVPACRQLGMVGQCVASTCRCSPPDQASGPGAGAGDPAAPASASPRPTATQSHPHSAPSSSATPPHANGDAGVASGDSSGSAWDPLDAGWSIVDAGEHIADGVLAEAGIAQQGSPVASDAGSGSGPSSASR